MDSIRQKQVASLVQQAMSEVFIREGRGIYGSAFVTITQIKMTPDLLIARVYLSIYNVKEKQEVVDTISYNTAPIRRLIGNRLRHKVRRIPQLEFFLDETLDEADSINKLIDDIKSTREEGERKKDSDSNTDTED